MEGCVPMLSKKLRDLRIRNFEELHKFGVRKESDLAQDKKFFSGRNSGREGIGSNNIVGPSHNVQINAIREPRRFSNLGRPLSKVLEKLVENNLILPLPQRPPFPNVDPKYYCKYHQSIGHDTDGCIRLKHEVQDLIDSGKITDPETRKPNTRNNPLPNYHNMPLQNP